jgi:hypothetical protein
LYILIFMFLDSRREVKYVTKIIYAFILWTCLIVDHDKTEPCVSTYAKHLWIIEFPSQDSSNILVPVGYSRLSVTDLHYQKQRLFNDTALCVYLFIRLHRVLLT